MTKVKRSRFGASIYRLVIRNIQGYGSFPVAVPGHKRTPDLCPQLDALKARVLDCILQRQSRRAAKLLNWAVAWQTHAASGLPHLDVLLVFQKKIFCEHTIFDYVIKKLNIRQRDVGDQVGVGHVWVTAYSARKLSKAVLQYGQKQDPALLTNMTPQTKDDLVRVSRLKADPYAYLYDQMCKDPLHFNLQQYVKQHQLSRHISSWSSLKTKLKDMQVAAANLALKRKPGFKLITRQLIQQRLSPQQLHTYDSWPGYQAIVDKLNQVVVHKGDRQQKTKNLLITGAPNTGKSALVWQRHPLPGRAALSNFCSIYPMGMSQWFPKYQSDVYHCIYWNQMKLTAYSYDTILKLLDGSPLDLPNKGSVSRKVDNPLIVMTSNMTLQQMIAVKFNYSPDLRQLARKNLAVRVQQVKVPAGHDLFLLQKLLVPSPLGCL
jgi:hypothetical protein